MGERPNLIAIYANGKLRNKMQLNVIWYLFISH